MKIEILGVNIDQINFASTLSQIDSWARGADQKFVVTVNPEFLVAAQANPKFKEILNSADLATCDGTGLVLAARFLHGKKLTRVTGSDLSRDLLKNPNLKLFLLGGAEETITILNKKFVHANIVGSSAGGRLNSEYQLENNGAVLNQIRSSGANVLLVAFGQVKQETWIHNNLATIPNIKVAIGVGGTFDFLAGQAKRAPKWMRAIGLEWLYRLLKQPNRIRRIWRATGVFCLLVLREKNFIRNLKF